MKQFEKIKEISDKNNGIIQTSVIVAEGISEPVKFFL